MVFLMFACGVHLPDPVVESVAPDRGWNGEETLVTIQGQSFFPQVEIDANRAGSVDLDRGYQAWLEADGLGRHPLAAVAVESYGELRASIPSGLAAGVYDLVVEGPAGNVGSLDQAFTVSNTRADRLTIDAGDLVATVNDQVNVAVQLVDPGGRPVLADLEVIVRAQGVAGPLVGFIGGGLDLEVPLDEGIGVRGFLGPDGAALIPLSIQTPDTVVITVDSADPSTAIRSGDVRQLWQAGDQLVTEFILPSPDFDVAAGEPFPLGIQLKDQFGNDVLGVSETVLVQSSCGDFIDAWLLTGRDTFQVATTRSTEFGNCPEQRLTVLQGPAGRSDPFTVRSGLPEMFRVTPVFAEVQAGDEVIASISARDGFDNRTVFPAGLMLQDSVGGLGTPVCVPALNQVDQNCRVPSFVAGDAVQLTATAGPVSGVSTSYTVVPRREIRTFETLAPVGAVAGQSSLLRLSFFDPFDNLIPGNLLDLSSIMIDDELGQRAPCTLNGFDLDGRALFGCSFERARADAQLAIGVEAITIQTSVFSVVNGPLDHVDVAAPATVPAGQRFFVRVQGFDAFNNPYGVSSIGAAVLTEPTIGSVPILFDATGVADIEVQITQSGSTVITAFDPQQSLLGTSGAVNVLPGPGTVIAVTLDAAWVFLGDPVTVRFQVLDVFGNDGLESGPVVLVSEQGAGTPVNALLVQGTGEADFIWSSPAIDETIRVDAALFGGRSQRIDVVRSCGSDGPTIGIDFGGAPFGRACLTGAPAPVAVSLATSTAGVEPIALHVVQVQGRDPVHSATPAFNVTVEEPGESHMDALVVDAAGCGAVGDAQIWVGPDDGQPVGALVTNISAATFNLGESVDVDIVGAVDCTGDPSTGQVQVRTDRGVLVGPMPTGSGLAVPLDATGSASFRLDATNVATGGRVTIEFASPSGGAVAQLQLDLFGDDQGPRVWSQSPSGFTEEPVSTVTLEFDEPLLPSTVTISAFSIDGASTSTGISAVDLIGGRQVELTLATPALSDSDVFTVLATSELRDLSGNRLDGAEIAAPSDWNGSFGVLPSALHPVECSQSVHSFRPDGDPGFGIEADQVDIVLFSASTPTNWLLGIADEQGNAVDQIRTSATTPIGNLSWNGADQTGRIVDDGLYTLRLAAEDVHGNRTTPCLLTVLIDNLRTAP